MSKSEPILKLAILKTPLVPSLVILALSYNPLTQYLEPLPIHLRPTIYQPIPTTQLGSLVPHLVLNSAYLRTPPDSLAQLLANLTIALQVPYPILYQNPTTYKAALVVLVGKYKKRP